MYEARTTLIRAREGSPPAGAYWQAVFLVADLIALAAVSYLNRHLSPVLLATFAVSVVALFAVTGLYRPTLKVSILDQGPVAVAMVSVATMLALTMNFLVFKAEFDERSLALLWLSATVMVFTSRVVALPLRAAIAAAMPKRRTIIVGSGKTAVLAAGKMDAHADIGMELIGFVDDGPRQAVRGRAEPLLGPVNDLERIIDTYKVESVVLAFVKNGYVDILRALYHMEPKVEVLIIPRYFEYLSIGTTVDALGNLPIMRLMHHRIGTVSALLKRFEDVVLASTILVVTAPFWVVIATGIKLSSPGPVFYKGTRIGKNLRPFEQLKFRTMSADADSDMRAIEAMKASDDRGWKLKQDPRITPFGRFLRRSSLDELPQVLNVLMGQMSFVGPRPPAPGELEAYEEWQKKRLSVRPGLTGMWQVSGRSDLPFDERIWLDFLYIDTWSLWLDLKIMVRTVGAVLSARGAY